MATLSEIRQQYPQYSDMSDEQLADGLYQKHYSDMPRADFDAKLGIKSAAPSYGVGLTRAAAQGLTFGFADEAEAYVRSKLGGGDYDTEVARIRGSNKAFADENPVTAFGAEVAGSLPTAFVPGMGGANLTRAIAQGGAKGIAKASGNVGLRTGAAHGLGSAEGSFTDRLPSAATSGALGYPLGFVGGTAAHYIGQGIGRIAQSASDLIREGSDPAVNAARRVNRALMDDQTSPTQIIGDIVPQYGRGAQALPQADVENILTKYGQQIGNGANDAAARQAVVADLVQQGVNPNTAANRVREVTRRWNERHQIPMQLHELPALKDGSRGTQSNMAMRVAANRENDAADAFRSSVYDRQLGLGEEGENIVSRALGGRNADDMLLQAREAHRQQNRVAYKAAEDADEAARIAAGLAPATRAPGNTTPIPNAVRGVAPLNVDDIVNTMHVKWRAREGDVAKGMREAVSFMTDPATGGGPTTLSGWLDAKEVLDGLIDDSMKAALVPGGKPQATTLTRELMQFKKDLMGRVSKQNPLFAKANADAAKGFSELKAGEMARDLTLRAGSRQRSALREFNGMTTAQQDMVRVMVAQNISDAIANKGRTHDISKLFNTPAAMRTLKAVLGDAPTGELMAHMNRIGIASRTNHHLGGQSQTAPLNAAMKEADVGERIRQYASYLNLPGAVRGISDYAAGKINAKRDAELLRIVGTSTERPDQLIGALRGLEAQRQQQQGLGLLPSPVRNPGPYTTLPGAMAAQRSTLPSPTNAIPPPVASVPPPENMPRGVAGFAAPAGSFGDQREAQGQPFQVDIPYPARPQGQYIPNSGEGELPMPEGPPGEMTLPDYGLGPMTARTQRGLPNPELRNALPTVSGHGVPDGAAARDFIGQHGPQMAYEMTGIPSIQRGAGNIARGYREGDPLRAAAGGGEMVLGAVPAASVARGGRALKAATATPGRTAAAAGATLGPMAGADIRDARASGQEKVAQAVEADPTVQRHRARLQNLREDLAKTQAPIAGMNKASADQARQRKAAPIQAEIDQLVGTPEKPGLIQQSEQQAAQNYLYNAPFRERYPGRAEAAIYAGGALSFALPGINAMRHRYADRFVHAPAIERQAERVENAIQGTTTQPNFLQRAMGQQPETIAPNRLQFEHERQVLRNKLDAREAREPTEMGNALAGAAIIQEAKMLPEEIDAMSFPPGHPARVTAEEQLRNPMYYLSGAVPSAIGGWATAHYGNKAGNMLSPSRVDTPRGKSAADLRWKGEQAPADHQSRMGRIGEAATRRLEYWLEPPPPRSPGSPPSGTPSSPGASQAAGGTATTQSPMPGPSSPPQSPPAASARNQGQGAAPSKPPYVREIHSDIAHPVVKGYLTRGEVPSTEALRGDLMAAYKQAGVQPPNRTEMTKRINATREIMELVKDAPPEIKQRALETIRNSARYLSVPAAIGAGAAVTDYGDRNMLAQ